GWGETPRAREPFAIEDLALDRTGTLHRRLEASERGEVQIRLVDARLLERVAGRREDRHHPLGHLDVEPAVAVSEDHRLLAAASCRLRQLPGARDRHAPADALAAGGPGPGPPHP